MDPRDLVLDGNAAAGTLREIFTVDMTGSPTTCAGCGSVRALGELAVYTGGPGIVARCRTCENVLLRVVRAGGRAWLDMRGLRCIELHL
ncbi:MAG: DUF6510 family protein [Actinomycetes bacterium]